jgi:2-keto-3-deoxy-6-phosphogluconate aldolase
MKRLEIVKQMLKFGLVAVIRAESKEQGVKIIDAVIKGV